MYQGASDNFAGPRDPILATSEDWGVDLEAEVAVITDDVPMGTPAALAGRHIKLVLLVNDVTARALIPDELAKGFGFLHGKPASAFSPVAVTPDELGPGLADHKLHLPLLSFINGKPFGKPDAGTDMTFDFARLIEHAAKTRRLVRAPSSAPARSPTRPRATRPATSAIPASPSGGCSRRSGTDPQDALAQLRRPGADRDAGRGRPLDLRYDRAGSRPLQPARGVRGTDHEQGIREPGRLAEKRETFDELARGVFALTAEGDPNSGVVIGDDSVLVIDARATPVMAKELVARIRKVTDKPIRHVLLTHYHAVRVLGPPATRSGSTSSPATSRAA